MMLTPFTSPPTYRELSLALPLLDEVTIRVVAELVLDQEAAPEARVDSYGQLVLAAWEWLTYLNFVSDHQRHLLLGKNGKASASLRDHARLLDDVLRQTVEHVAAPEGERAEIEWPGYDLVLGDEEWVTWTGHNAWYNIRFDRQQETLARPHIIVITGNVTAMYWRLWEHILQHRERHEPGSCDT